MSIVPLSEILDFLDVTYGYITITAVNNGLTYTSDQGGPITITLTDGTYDGDDIATEIQTQLNADATLTGTGTITFSVSYSSSTQKVTIDATAGHTISYDHSESSAGLSIGFNEDATAAQTITSNDEIGDPTSIVSVIHSSVEKFVKNYCGKDFEQTSYSKESYSGDGRQYLFLKNYPIIYLDRIAIGKRDVLRIKNTNDYSTASISVSSTGLRLVKDGTADETVLFSTYTTLTAVATAVKAISGWEAEVISSGTYSNFKSTELLPRYGASAIDDNWVNLAIAEEAIDILEVYENEGYVKVGGCFPRGSNNIFVDYTAGYSSSNMPEDLKMAIKILCKYIYDRRDQSAYGMVGYTVNKIKTFFEENSFPKEANTILWQYRGFRL